MNFKLKMARQPILDINKDIYAYELFYRDEDDSCIFDDARYATSSVLANALNQVGLFGSVGDSKAFINITANVLLTDIIYSLPNDKFVFELPADFIVTNKEKDALQEFTKKGYKFALDNAIFSDEYYNRIKDILKYITYVKIDTSMTDIELLEEKIHLYSDQKLIAQKVEIPEIYDAYLEFGFEYFQGYFFSKPRTIMQNRLESKYISVINIFNMLQHSENLDEVCDEFEKNSELSLQLLQYINSTKLVQSDELNSLREIIKKVGKDKLLQWILLVIYSKPVQTPNNTKNPMSTLVNQRIYFMVGLIKKIKNLNLKMYEEKVRYIGLLSLLESVFDVPKAYYLDKFDVDDEIRDALLAQAGDLGRVYAIALSLEKHEYSTAQVLLRHFHLNVDDIEDIVDLSAKIS